MSDEGDNNFVRYIYRGEEDEHIPEDVTHVTVHEFTTFVRRWAFKWHPNIVEVICHEKVERIEQEAFWCCRSLRRVIMPGVKIAEAAAFNDCRALTDVKCDKLERIGDETFSMCKALRSIHLPCAEVVEEAAFEWCEALTDVKFGKKLKRIEERAFIGCESLEQITIPLKNGLFTADDIFQGCDCLECIDLIEGPLLHETIAALHMEEWKNDMNEEIDSINETLPDTFAGWDDAFGGPLGEKAEAIRGWIRSVFGKIVDYQEEHQRVLNEASTTLQLALPRDIVMNNVISFLALPRHTFEEEDEDENEPEEEYSEGCCLAILSAIQKTVRGT